MASAGTVGVGLRPHERIAVDLYIEGIGLLLAVDWFLDRFRTSTNVWGDAVGAAVVDRYVRARFD